MRKTKLAEIIKLLEQLAPRPYQEDYDNSGLIVGNRNAAISGVLVSLDCLESVVDEAIKMKCNLIVSHHPILFKSLKRLSGDHYVERVIIKAIKNDIALYAMHTNLDNVYEGVNAKICEKLGLINRKILKPKKSTLSKLEFFAPGEDSERILKALFEAGAGNIGNYKNCSFMVDGIGSFTPNEHANPHIGKANQVEIVNEKRIEVIFPRYLESAIMKALFKSHPYEEVAYAIQLVENHNNEVGSGMLGDLNKPMDGKNFLKMLKKKMNLSMIKHTAISDWPIKKVAVCGGAGSFLLADAIKSDADAFISSDFKYHEYFEADGRLLIADIGHYESEIFTTELITDYLKENFSTFAINFSNTVTNPVSYLA
jgi:dinuclear metal center YbgI/SA1388 family protein